MKFIKKFLLNIIVLGFLLRVAKTYFPEAGFSVVSKYNDIITFGILGFVFWIFNTLIKEILEILSLPLKILTFGIFSLFINLIIFYFFKIAINQLNIGITVVLSSFLGVLVLSIVITAIYYLLKKIFI